MKTFLATSLSFFLLAIGMMPGTARADSMHDCTNGCYVVTCTGEICSVWRCDANGCHLLTTYHRNKPKALAAGRVAKPAPAAAEADYVKVCPQGDLCRLYELTTREAVLLGSFDNLDDIVAYRKAMRVAPARATGAARR